MTQGFPATTVIAKSFTEARLKAGGLPDYPGVLPTTLGEAYGIQEAAMEMWPHTLAGWKIGGIGGDYAVKLGSKKLAGPVYENQIYKTSGALIEMPVFVEGFAAIEPEMVIFVSKDAPTDKTSWSIEEARDFVGDVHIGVEIASSPFPAINDMGPLVTISDFGNNNGLIIGQKLSNWNETKPEDWVVETIIDGKSVGVTKTPCPMESFRFILENTAQRGRPLKKGMAITTGAITGVHQAFSGQSSTIHCSNAQDITLKLIPAT